MTSTKEQIEQLHTSAIDARNGYREAVEDADKHGLTRLFRDMIALHDRHADELAAALRKLGATTDDDGSFMSAVHRTIMSVRGLFGAHDESVLPGLIDGEERNVEKYDAILQGASSDGATREMLTGQRRQIADAIASMRAMKT